MFVPTSPSKLRHANHANCLSVTTSLVQQHPPPHHSSHPTQPELVCPFAWSRIVWSIDVSLWSAGYQVKIKGKNFISYLCVLGLHLRMSKTPLNFLQIFKSWKNVFHYKSKQVSSQNKPCRMEVD